VATCGSVLRRKKNERGKEGRGGNGRGCGRGNSQRKGEKERGGVRVVPHFRLGLLSGRPKEKKDAREWRKKRKGREKKKRGGRKRERVRSVCCCP